MGFNLGLSQLTDLFRDAQERSYDKEAGNYESKGSWSKQADRY